MEGGENTMYHVERISNSDFIILFSENGFVVDSLDKSFGNLEEAQEFADSLNGE